MRVAFIGVFGGSEGFRGSRSFLGFGTVQGLGFGVWGLGFTGVFWGCVWAFWCLEGLRVAVFMFFFGGVTAFRLCRD